MKKCLYACLICISLQNLNAKAPQWVETYGDIFQFLPAMAATYSLMRQDYEGLLQLALGTGTTLGITFISKYSFVGISHINERAAGISKRPNNGGFDGFPSGHTSSAFSAAGFMQKRYGWKWGVPTTILATGVGISRVLAQKHTIVQVITGALLGYGVSYLFAKRLHQNVLIDIGIETQEIAYQTYQNIYTIGFSYRF